MSLRVCLCGAQVPFVHGGAEVLLDSLRDELTARGHEVDIVRLPFAWETRAQVLKSCLAWRMLDLTSYPDKRADVVIATRFPSYVVRHPNKVVWLVHQFRQIYELKGTSFSNYGENDESTERLIRGIDERCLGEARGLFTISENTARRLRKYNGLDATPLYPPPRLEGHYRSGVHQDYVLAVGRLDPMKRIDRLIEAMSLTRSGIRCVVAGDGPQREQLERLVDRHDLSDRVTLAGFVSDEELLDLYSRALCVYNAPFDEDYGYVSIEAFKAARPLVSFADAGGALEFHRDGVSGFVCEPDDLASLAERLDQLYADREMAAAMGARGLEQVAGLGWDPVIEGLLLESGCASPT